jgi:putative ABC transport system substrate-binding protein
MRAMLVTAAAITAVVVAAVRIGAPLAPAYTASAAPSRRGRPDAILIGPGPLMSSQRPGILGFIAGSHLPSMIQSERAYVDAGALTYYAANELETYRNAAGYVDRILRGANPADMPIETPSKVDLIINMKTAKALGLTIPPSVLAQATELIQ